METVVYSPLTYWVVYTICIVVAFVLGVLLVYWIVGMVKKLSKEERAPTRGEVIGGGLAVFLYVALLIGGWISLSLVFAHRTEANNPAVKAEEKMLRELPPVDYQKVEEERAAKEVEERKDWARKRHDVSTEARQESDDYLKSLLESTKRKEAPSGE